MLNITLYCWIEFMSNITNTELWVNKTNLQQTRIVELDMPTLTDGQIRVAINKFALTANNITYAVSGDFIGYWHYFPTNDGDWGKVTVWGIATVVESNHSDISLGEQLYGFFPMAQHVVLQPDEIKAQMFIDATDYRQELPALYNQYNRCQADPEIMKTLQNERCVLFPLFITGYIIADFLADNHYFSAEQIIIGSASSKTGYSVASFLKANGYQGKVVALTSSQNTDFVNQLGLFEQVISYDEINTLDNIATAYVDMSGNSQVLSDLHHHLQDNIKTSQLVGATHWQRFGKKQSLPGAKPVLFFAPDQIKKRSDEIGAKAFMEQSLMASAQLAQQLNHLIDIEHHQGVEALQTLWLAMLDNQVSGQRGLMFSI